MTTTLALAIAWISVGIFALAVTGVRLAWELIKTAIVIVFAIGVLMLVGCSEPPSGDVVRTTELTAENHLPTKCRPYYNDGTERWINCMGVGYK